MEIKSNIVIIEEADGISHFISSLDGNAEYMSFCEISGTRVMISTKTVLRLHSILRDEIEKRGIFFLDYCESLFEKEKQSET